MHDGHQNSLGTDGVFQILQGYPPPCVHRQVSDLEPLALQILHGLQHRRMFHLGGDQMIALSAVCHGTADQRQIVGFRPPRSKKDFLCLNLQDTCQRLSGIAQILLGLHTFAVQAGGIAVLFAHDFCNQFRHLGERPCGCGII